jgi:putative acetyltransferase
MVNRNLLAMGADSGADLLLSPVSRSAPSRMLFVGVCSPAPEGFMTSERSTVIRTEPLSSPVAAALITRLNAELSGRYPEVGATHFRLDAGEVAPGVGAFLVAYAGEEPVGCGAVRGLDASTAEIKRMYVVPGARRLGVGRALLAALEERARALGRTRILLETGLRQPEARALYREAGFVETAPFGEYLGSALSVCMAKDLAESVSR